MRQLRALAIFEQDETRWRCRRPREAIDETGDDRIGQYAVVLSAASVATPAIPQGYRHHQETAFQFPCPVELHSARYPGPLSN